MGRAELKFCEFPGTKDEPWDGRLKGKCQYLGFRNCTKHIQPIEENEEGWRQPCERCTEPFYISEEENGGV